MSPKFVGESIIYTVDDFQFFYDYVFQFFFYDYVSFPITTYICRDSPIRLPFLEMVFLVTPPFSSGIFTPATFD